jgi:hypothetical protein
MTQNVGGFVVLVDIPVGRGLPYRDAYLVGCSSHQEAAAKVKDLYPTEPDLRLYVSALRAEDTKGLKLASNEVSSWEQFLIDLAPVRARPSESS